MNQRLRAENPFAPGKASRKSRPISSTTPFPHYSSGGRTSYSLSNGVSVTASAVDDGRANAGPPALDLGIILRYSMKSRFTERRRPKNKVRR